MPQLDPTANFTGPFRFFDFPRELRDMVYNQCWLPTTSYFKLPQNDPERQHMAIMTWGRCERSPPPAHSYPIWFYVNKCFRAEAFEEFYVRCGLLAFIEGSYLTTRFYCGVVGTESSHRHTVNWEVKKLLATGAVPTTEPSNDYLAPVVNAIEPWPVSMATLKEMKNALVDDQGHRGLHIAFAVIKKVKPGVTVDLSVFESTGFTLDKLVVEVFHIDHGYFIPHADILLIALKAEVSRLGHVLVGQKSRVSLYVETKLAVPNWRFSVTKA
ncbi:hypothetical protein N0V83_003619 [Neocucurbitaria cava]|uniref:Uncharacterized protein n=1 Tax=Neocucurbitaria cava TaxID=798079 RepID=A0A9W8YBR0_9PLEO|nr:hypothetical protein N0V83_003619 [Neocucurbitaria cava]